MASEPQGNETFLLLFPQKAAQSKNFISKRLKKAILVLPLVRMHWLLLGARKGREKCVCVSGPWGLRLSLEKEEN